MAECKNGGNGSSSPKDECTKLSYLKDNQIRMRIRVKRKRRLSSSKEIGTTTSTGDVVVSKIPNVAELATSNREIQTANQDPAEDETKNIRVSAPETDVTSAPIASRSKVSTTQVEQEVKGQQINSQEINSQQINSQEINDKQSASTTQIVNFQNQDFSELRRFRPSGPARLEPVFPEQNDIRYLLNFARERGQNAPPPWQREGTFHVNQLLHSLNPLTTPLVSISFPLQIKCSNANGSTVRTLQLHFWLIGLAIANLAPSTQVDADFDALVYQLRTPMRRLHKLNFQIQTSLRRPFKKVQRWLKPVVQELNREVYQYILRMTPPPLSVTMLDKFEQVQRLSDVDELRQGLQKSQVVVTSFATLLVVSSERDADSGNRTFQDLSQRSRISVVQAILTFIESILKKMKTEADDFENLMKSRVGRGAKSSFKKLAKTLTKMRTDHGLRYVTTTHRLAESLKSLELELSLVVSVMEDVKERLDWLEEAAEVTLAEAEKWLPAFWHEKLRLNRSLKSLKCFRSDSRWPKTFEQLFPLEDFGQKTDSFQIRVPVRLDCLSRILSEPLRKVEVEMNFDEPFGVKGQVASTTTTTAKEVPASSKSSVSNLVTPGSTPALTLENRPLELLIF